MASWLQQQASQAGTGRYAMRASQDAAADAEDPNRTPPSVRRSSAALRASVLEIPSDMSPGRSERAFRTGNERLYEAYNDLHALAQDFEKPFDAPAILVVGHQTDGKSGGCPLQARPGAPAGQEGIVTGRNRQAARPGSSSCAAPPRHRPLTARPRRLTTARPAPPGRPSSPICPACLQPWWRR